MDKRNANTTKVRFITVSIWLLGWGLFLLFFWMRYGADALHTFLRNPFAVGGMLGSLLAVWTVPWVELRLRD